MMNLEKTILRTLIYNEEYFRKVLPFLKDEYFTGYEQSIFKEIIDYSGKYNSAPGSEALIITFNEKNGLNTDQFKEIIELIGELESGKTNEVQVQWLIDQTEAFCKEKAIINALQASIMIMDGKDKTHDKGYIPTLLTQALSVAFDPSIGHDYKDDAEARFDYYHEVQNRIPFDIDYLNKITKGGVPPKTLNVLIAGVNVGKTLGLCHLAASYMSLGYDVLYITMEMAEEEIAKRIDANLLNVSMDDLMDLSKEMYLKRVQKVRDNTVGKLIIKEYPTAAASVTHFRTLINELNLKKSFRPKVILVDYLNICCSARIKQGANVNSYTYVKSIAEELRGFAVELGVPLWTATQLTRTGFNSSDVDMDDTAESFGLPATADFMGALITSEELEAMNQIMFKQLKSRYGDKSINKRFVIGIDKAKQRWYNVEQGGQTDIVHDIPDTPLNTFGNRDGNARSRFEKFKV